MREQLAKRNFVSIFSDGNCGVDPTIQLRIYGDGYLSSHAHIQRCALTEQI